MRISLDQNSPDFHDHASFCRIYLAGAERSNVWLADEEARFAQTIKLDEFGVPVKGKDGGMILEPYWGDVRVDCAQWLRDAIEHKPAQEEQDALSLAILGMITTP